MHYVYILQSIANAEQVYVGMTSNIKKRFRSHNSGENKHTKKFKPWKLAWFCVFPSKIKAAAFEQYLKQSSGIAFPRKRLM